MATTTNLTNLKINYLTEAQYNTEITNGTIDENAIYMTPEAGVSSGGISSLTDLGVTATAAELNIMDGITATTTELNYVDGVTSNIQTQLNSKQPTIIGAATTVASSNLTADKALISNSSGKITVGSATSTELGYLSGVTSNIQTQLNGKLSTSGTAEKANGLVIQSSINSSTDLDAFITASTLKCTLVGSSAGTGSDGMVLSIPWSNTSYGCQMFFNDDSNLIKYRTKSSSSWNGWSTLWGNNNLTFSLSGTTLTITTS